MKILLIALVGTVAIILIGAGVLTVAAGYFDKKQYNEKA